MAESVNTGGTHTFVYPKDHKIKRDSEIEQEIKEGYEEYEKRKRGWGNRHEKNHYYKEHRKEESSNLKFKPHKIVHEETRVSKCKFCDKTFSDIYQLKSHEKIHLMGILGILFIVIAALILLIIFLPNFFFKKPILNCSDGTPVGNCSIQKPLFCLENGSTTENSPLCGCSEGNRVYQNRCIPIVVCKQDGTLEPECSKNKPYQCVNGELVGKASVCGCPADSKIIGENCKTTKKCSEGTVYSECSILLPKYCFDGKLIDKASLCGCPEGYRVVGDACKIIERCSDGTIYGECSSNRPKYCSDGILIDKASTCGCSSGKLSDGDICIIDITLECDNSIRECITIGESKYAAKITILKEQIFTDASAGADFFNTWKGPNEFSLSYETEPLFGVGDQLQYPAVFFGVTVRGAGGQVPTIVFCGADGKMYSRSKASLGC